VRSTESESTESAAWSEIADELLRLLEAAVVAEEVGAEEVGT